MAKTNHRVNVEEVERDEESPSHKNRRQTQNRIRDIIKSNGFEDEQEYEEFDRFEKIRPKHTKR